MDTYDHPIYGSLAQLDTSQDPPMTYLRGTRAPLLIVEKMLVDGMQPHEICKTPWLDAKGAEETVELLCDVMLYRLADAQGWGD